MIGHALPIVGRQIDLGIGHGTLKPQREPRHDVAAFDRWNSQSVACSRALTAEGNLDPTSRRRYLNIEQRPVRCWVPNGSQGQTKYEYQ
jgi:hypothetical protein